MNRLIGRWASTTNRATTTITSLLPTTRFASTYRRRALHNDSSSSPKYLFVGAGRMASALMRSFLHSNLIPKTDLVSVEPDADRRSVVEAELGIDVVESVEESQLADSQPIVFLCVKPKVISSIMDDVASIAPDLVVSIAAGVTTSTIERDTDARVVRVMPNMPCLVGEAASAISAGCSASEGDVQLVQRLMSAVGEAIVVPEYQLDAVTGLSGSGPAYVFLLIEAMADAGVAAGLSREHAQSMAAQTVMGAAKMVQETGQHPAQLKDAVDSPAGTTSAGLLALEQGGFRGLIADAVLAASRKATSLAIQQEATATMTS